MSYSKRAYKWELCSPLGAIFHAAFSLERGSLFSNIVSRTADYVNIQIKHAALNHQLHTKGLEVFDVKGDRNCLFRAISYLLTGSEDADLATLRASIAAFAENLGAVLGGVLNVSAKYHTEHVSEMRTNGVCVGEEAVLIIPDVIQRDITIYMAFAELLFYKALKWPCHWASVLYCVLQRTWL